MTPLPRSQASNVGVFIRCSLGSFPRDHQLHTASIDATKTQVLNIMDQDHTANTNCSDSPSSDEGSQCAESSQASTSARSSQRQLSTEADSVDRILAVQEGPSRDEWSEAEQATQHGVELREQDGQEDDVASELSSSVDSEDSLEPCYPFGVPEFDTIDLIEEAVKRGQPVTAQAASQPPLRLTKGGGKWLSTLVTLTVDGTAGAARHYFNSDLWRYGGRTSLLRHADWHETDSIDLKVSHEHVLVEVSFHKDKKRHSTTWSWKSDEKGIFRMHPEHIHVVEMVCGYLNIAVGRHEQYWVDRLFELPHGTSHVSPVELHEFLERSFVRYAGVYIYPPPRPTADEPPVDRPHTARARVIATTCVVEALTRVDCTPMQMEGVAPEPQDDNLLKAPGSETSSIEGTFVRLPSVWSVCGGSPCICGDSVMVLDTTHHQLSVRELAPGEQYLAISYVWTQHDESSLLSYVRRATEVTGVFSVWLDRLCINQRCGQHKARQVPRMREVYQKAYATVALVPDITEILPTIFHAPTAIVAYDTLSVAKTFIRQMKSCIWRTRCWTWQEGLLGRRGYYVTQKQVLPARIVSDNLTFTTGYRPYRAKRKVGIGSGLMDSLGVCSLRCRIKTWGQEISIGDLVDAEDLELIQYWLMPPQAESLSRALFLTQYRTASRPEDEIYSVLGMVPRGEELRVVYGESRNAILRRAVDAGLLGAEILLSNSVSDRAGESWAAKDDTSRHIGRIYTLSLPMRGPIQIDDTGLESQFHRLDGLTEVFVAGGHLVLDLAWSTRYDHCWMYGGGEKELTALVDRVDQVLLVEGERPGRFDNALLVSGTGRDVVRLATVGVGIMSWKNAKTTVVWRVVG